MDSLTDIFNRTDKILLWALIIALYMDYDRESARRRKRLKTDFNEKAKPCLKKVSIQVKIRRLR